MQDLIGNLVGNGFNVQNNQPAWGYADNTNNLNPAVSKLHYIYSVDGNPNVRLKILIEMEHLQQFALQLI